MGKVKQRREDGDTGVGGWLKRRREAKEGEAEETPPATQTPPSNSAFQDQLHNDPPTGMDELLMHRENSQGRVDGSLSLPQADADRSILLNTKDFTTGVPEFTVENGKKKPTGYDAEKQPGGKSPADWAYDQYFLCYQNVARKEQDIWNRAYGSVRALASSKRVNDAEMAAFDKFKGEMGEQARKSVAHIDAALELLDERHADVLSDPKVQWARDLVVQIRDTIFNATENAKRWTIQLSDLPAIEMPAAVAPPETPPTV